MLPLRVARVLRQQQIPPTACSSRESCSIPSPIGAAFAVTPAHPVLRDILDKVIAIIPPDELEGLSNRWQVQCQTGECLRQELIQEFGLYRLDLAVDPLGWPGACPCASRSASGGWWRGR